MESAPHPRLVLHFAPDTCARVTMVALEEIGIPFETVLVAFARGDHHSEEFRAANPKGKVPVLVVDERPLTENVAILWWLNRRFPEARLLPPTETEMDTAEQLATLAWCASQVHPLVTRARIPQFFCPDEKASPLVRETAFAALDGEFARIETRLEEGPWWYGERWSIIDAYINWAWFRVTGAGFDGSRFPRLTDHDSRLRERPSVARTLARHAQAAEELERRGLALNFDRLQLATLARKAS